MGFLSFYVIIIWKNTLADQILMTREEVWRQMLSTGKEAYFGRLGSTATEKMYWQWLSRNILSHCRWNFETFAKLFTDQG